LVTPVENLAEVILWGKQVGALAYDSTTGLSTFEYAPHWRELGIEIAPLHMPLAAQKYQFPALLNPTYRGLPAVFADTLPDDFGNAVINAWLARQGRDPSSFSPVERLLYTGERGMGALEYAPPMQRDRHDGGTLELDNLVSLAQQVFNERARLNQHLAPLHNDASAMRAIMQVGTSAGGARAKAVVAINAERSEIRSGQVHAPEGFEHYLLKLDGVQEHSNATETFGDPQGFGRMEYAYYLMATAAGITMSPSELLLEGARAHFLTQRFDRIGNQKLHFASLCALDHADYKKPGTYSYEQLLGTARKLRLPRADAIELFRRMVFNVVARNHDDHSKNFGFLLASPQSTWRLAPAFDVAYSYKPGSPWVNSHQLSLNGKRDNFTRRDLQVVATLINNFREADGIIDKVISEVSNWRNYAEQAAVAPELRDKIQGNLRLDI
jgi:serine/threonine-protein kinase HipA